jgi:hypothetical protein
VVVVGGESDLGNQLDGTEAELVGNAGIPKSPRIDLATSDEVDGCVVGCSAGPCPIGLGSDTSSAYAGGKLDGL